MFIEMLIYSEGKYSVGTINVYVIHHNEVKVSKHKISLSGSTEYKTGE